MITKICILESWNTVLHMMQIRAELSSLQMPRYESDKNKINEIIISVVVVCHRTIAHYTTARLFTKYFAPN